MPIDWLNYREVWLVDFEFSALPGEQVVPVCMVAHELVSDSKLRLWQEELMQLKAALYATDKNALFVAYYASAEMNCHLALNWPMPENVLDLYAEFRNLTNGLYTPCGNGLLGALTYFGLNGIKTAEKDSMRGLALRGGPWTDEERKELLQYCESDVIALAGLFQKMSPLIDLPRALLRGRYMKAAAQIEHTGIPIDMDALEELRTNWTDIQEHLIQKIDAQYGVFDGRTFKADRFAEWLTRNNIPWPRLESGKLDLQDETFKEMARSYPAVAPLRELRVALSQMKLSELTVGKDGRNRCLLSAFQARTSRNQPSNSKFIFGPAVWLRGLIKPAAGYGIAYIDWSQQEFGIAAALSNDPLMLDAYTSGDPYLTFAKQTGAAPQDATKQSHATQREQFKACVLAVQYGMGEASLACRIGQSTAVARHLLQLHHETYKAFWKWSDGVVDHAMLRGKLWTTFGWTMQTGTDPNPRSLRNFPMQANGAEMLRLACCFAVEKGIRICAPVHDAILVEAPLEDIETTISATQQAMSDASNIILGGFRLRSDAKIVRYSDRYMDERGVKMWDTVWEIVKSGSPKRTCAPVHTPPVHECNSTCAPMHTRPILLSVSNNTLIN